MHIDKKTLRNIFIGVISCIVIYWILHETERVKAVFSVIKSVVSPFILGAGLAFIINVPMRGIEGLLGSVTNIKLRRIVAVALTFIVIALILTLVFVLLIPQMTNTVQSLIPKLYTFVIESEKNITGFLEKNPQVMEWVVQNTDFENLDWAGLAQKVISVFGTSVSTIINRAFSAIGSITDALVDAVIAIVFSLYCLFQKELLARQGRKIIYAFLPEKFCDHTVRIFRLANATFSNFLSGQCIEVCILGCLFAVAMAIFGMPYIPLVSVLVAVTAFIPVVGAWAGCVLGTFFILVANPMQALWFVVLFVVLQQIENNLIYPRVVGTSIGLSGMWVLVAVAVGGELMGVAGMFLMIPVASVLQTVLRELTNKRLDGMDIDPDKLKEHPPEIAPVRSIKFKLPTIKRKKEKKDQ